MFYLALYTLRVVFHLLSSVWPGRALQNPLGSGDARSCGSEMPNVSVLLVSRVERDGRRNLGSPIRSNIKLEAKLSNK